MADVTKLSLVDVCARYPRIVSHLIAESLGYFTPESAANAIQHYQVGRAFYCEMYDHYTSRRYEFEAAEKIRKEKGAGWNYNKETGEAYWVDVTVDKADIPQLTREEYEARMVDQGVMFLKNSIEGRKRHVGYMGSYQQALQIVKNTVIRGRGPVFASWF
jgi:hypothetical protein